MLNSAISRAATLLSGVQLHQLMVPEVAEPPSPLFEVVLDYINTALGELKLGGGRLLGDP